MNRSPSSAFGAFDLDPRLVEAVAALGFDAPTPIQSEAIPALMRGRDVIGRARTGSGKTAAFGLPMLERIKDGPDGVRALLLAPTRELAIQMTEALRAYAQRLPLRVVTLYGGAAYEPQLRALRRGVPIVVGTPGRVLDHLDRGTLDLSGVQVLVLDEADEMLRMGFLEDVARVVEATPASRQVALFSATMPAPIRSIASSYMRDPLQIQVEDQALSTGHIEQRWLLVPQRHKEDALRRVLAAEPSDATLVFVRTRAGCAEVASQLAERGLSVDALHGDLSQGARELVLGRLRARQLDVVVATDVAARGIDVEHLSHVVNFDLPNDAESYVHRIGRTGRAGRAGVAISLVTPREVGKLRAFQRALDVRIEPMRPPSDADIQARRRQRLESDVRAALGVDAGASGGLEAMADALLAEGSPRDVVAAALRALARRRGFDVESDASDAPPAWSRSPRAKKPRAGARAADEGIQLFLAMGKSRGLRPKDVVGALANEVGIPVGDIGRIRIGVHGSFLGVPADVGEHLLNAHPTLQLRGVDVRLAKARPRPGGSGAPGGHRGAKRRPGPKPSRRGPGHAKHRGPSKPKRPKHRPR
jgi:ATP-dependent RNA helicase DeaD